MGTEDVLRVTGTGLWRWVSATGATTVDALAAHLIGLPESPPEGGTLTLTEPAFRSRVHAVDYVELQSIVTLALAEGTPAEALLRVVGDDGEVVRTVRTRLVPEGEEGRGEGVAVAGTVVEVPDPAVTRGRPAVDWGRNREAFLLDAGRALAEARSTSEVLRVADSLAMPGFSPSSLVVFRLDGDRLRMSGRESDIAADDKWLRPLREIPLTPKHPASEAVLSGRAVYLRSPEEYRRRYPAAWPLAEPLGRRAWAFMPLTVSGRSLGAWMAAFSNPVPFTADERSVLTTVARMLAQALSRTSLRESERELAESLQRTMRPVHKPDIPGMTLAARYVPTGGGLQVGGDWYDVIPLPSGRTALVIGDVQGHDVRAAGVMAQLRIALRAYAAEGHHPEAVLSRASRFLAGMGRTRWAGDGQVEEDDEEEGAAPADARARTWDSLGVGSGSVDARARRGDDSAAGPAGVRHQVGDAESEDRFATCLYVEADPATGILDVARAGHPDPAIWLPDGTMLVRPTAGGLPLGIEPDADYPTTRMILEPGETLLLCTDGLIETGGHDLESGWSRIRRVFHEQAEHGCGASALERLADALVYSVHGPHSHQAMGPLLDRREDDIALLLLAHDVSREAVGSAEVEGVTRRTVLTISQAEADRIGEARRQLQGLLHDWESEDQIDGAVLMLSEMLTNVLVHTEGDARMVAESSGKRGQRLLRVEVSDSSDELPHRRKPGELASSGRGLVLLEMLAGEWGVDPQGEGKRIWFEMRENEPAPQWE